MKLSGDVSTSLIPMGKPEIKHSIEPENLTLLEVNKVFFGDSIYDSIEILSEQINDNEKRKIQVVMPMFNRSYLLRKSLSYWKKQTFKDFNIILVDDGSADADESRRIAQEFSYVNFYAVEHGGCGSARNVGIQKAESNFIIFFDSDDAPIQTLIEECYAKFLAGYEVIRFTPFLVIGSDDRIKAKSGSISRRISLKEDWSIPDLATGWFGGNFAISKEVYRRIIRFPLLFRYQDIATHHLIALQKVKKTHLINSYVWKQQPNGLTGSKLDKRPALNFIEKVKRIKIIPKVYIGILSFNALTALKETIYAVKRNLKNLKYHSVVTIFDNGSTDGSVEFIKGLPFRYFLSPENVGISKARNWFIEDALNTRSDFYFMLDCDVVLPVNCIRVLTEILCKSEDSVLGVGLDNLAYTVNDDFTWLINESSLDVDVCEKEYLLTQSGIYKLNLFSQFNLRFSVEGEFSRPGWGAEDDWIKKEINRQGFKVLELKNVKVKHFKHSSWQPLINVMGIEAFKNSVKRRITSAKENINICDLEVIDKTNEHKDFTAIFVDEQQKGNVNGFSQ